MKKAKVSNLRIKDIEPFEHLDFVVEKTTPAQRFKGLEELWNLWYYLRKNVHSPKIAALQDRLRRQGKV